jgi:tRNA modification GTPase
MAKASSSGWSSALAGGADTIVARSTAAGPAALAVVRLSGADTRTIAGRIAPAIDFGEARRASLVTLAAGVAGGERAMAIPYAAPRSYTGEDMLELMVHGSPYLVEGLVDALVQAGARPAGPGEFTRRAVANGKMDLVQAEAVRDLVSAETAWQARIAHEQLSGSLSRRFVGLRSNLIALQARLEAALDFAAQGVEADDADVARRLAVSRREVADLLATGEAGERIRDGVRVVIVGPPNSGKSTLFNRLLGSDRAIVAAGPGTTRDLIEAELELAGIKVVLVDTAGLRPTGDPVEGEGVRRARAAMAGAGVVVALWPLDGGGPPPETVADGCEVLQLRSKADLAVSGWHPEPGWTAVSCLSGDGLEEVRRELSAVVSGPLPDLGGEVAIGRRHRAALERAARELAACDPREPELAAERVRWAAQAIAELIGAVVTDEVLDEVFNSFCIGK